MCLSVGEYLWLATAPSQRSHGLCASPDIFIVSRCPSGRYIVDGALQPVMMDCEKDVGRYEDPNVWMRHGLDDVESDQ